MWVILVLGSGVQLARQLLVKQPLSVFDDLVLTLEEAWRALEVGLARAALLLLSVLGIARVGEALIQVLTHEL